MMQGGTGILFRCCLVSISCILALGIFPGSVCDAEVVVDCNQNGIDDLVETQPLQLRAAPEFPAVDFPLDSVSADFDGDGDLDVIISDYTDFQTWNQALDVVLLRNDGRGAFGPPEPLGLGQAGPFLAAGDLDGNGSVDLAMAAWPKKVVLAFNCGDGRFSDLQTLQSPDDMTQIEAVDLTGDGNLEVLVGGDRLPVHWSRAESGVFQPLVPINELSGSVSAVDLDADGDRDLLLNYGQGLALNRGDGTFDNPRPLAVPPDEYFNGAVASADLNGDGAMDLAIVQSSWSERYLVSLVIHLNDGTGRFVESERKPLPSALRGHNGRRTTLVVGDIEDDGDLDLVYAGNFWYQVGVLRNRGDGTFIDGESHTVDSTVGLHIEDFDADGNVDVGVGGRSFVLLRNEGQGQLRSAEFHPYRGPLDAVRASGFISPVVADFDGDGALDLAVGHQGEPRLSVFRNLGNRRLAEAVEVHLPTYATSLAPVNRDGDRHTQLAVTTYANDGVRFLRANDAFEFSEAEFLAVPKVRRVQSADLDGDNILDLLTQPSGYLLPFLAHQGAWRAGAVVASAAGMLNGYVSLDLNADGHSEVLFRGRNFALALATGLDRDQPHLSIIPGDFSFDVGTATDANGDGAQDAIVGVVGAANGRFVDHLHLLHGDGLGSLHNAERLDWPTAERLRGKMASGDLNLDGKLDVTVGSAVILNAGGLIASRPIFHAAPAWAGPPVVGNTNPYIDTVLADLDSDQRPEAIVVQSATGSISPRGLWVLWNDTPPNAVRAVDCDLNRVPDECDARSSDCNRNGVPDACDADVDRDSVPDDCDEDADGDGQGAEVDECPLDPQKLAPAACGCNVFELDNDGDGVANCVDLCVNDRRPEQRDRDQDGVGDLCDACPLDAEVSQPGLCPCGEQVDPLDDDLDTVVNCLDACPAADDRLDTNDNEVADCADLCHPLKGGVISESARGDGTCDQRHTAADLGAIVRTMASNVRSSCGGEDVDGDCRATGLDVLHLLDRLFRP